jgi:hypothetical protein
MKKNTLLIIGLVLVLLGAVFFFFDSGNELQGRLGFTLGGEVPVTIEDLSINENQELILDFSEETTAQLEGTKHQLFIWVDGELQSPESVVMSGGSTMWPNVKLGPDLQDLKVCIGKEGADPDALPKRQCKEWSQL